MNARLIAFYLPQFHPIPENDLWWGPGFTEWTNVARAQPLFHGHYQPHIPADLGFYDLRVPETRALQAELAQTHGIQGFCYWHYWFAGKRLLERPFLEVLESGEPEFPFCLAWANQTWTGVWHGSPDKILIEQTYPGVGDHKAHFYALLDAFRDARYITIEDKPVFLVYSPYSLPEPRRFTDLWRDLALAAGLRGLYFVAVAGVGWDPLSHGFDASVVDNPGVVLHRLGHFSKSRLDRICKRLTGKDTMQLWKNLISRPTVYAYSGVVQQALPNLAADFDQYPCVIPNWDNTPRSGINGIVFHDSTPDLFRVHLRDAIQQVAARERDKRVVFIKSWNEWAEGNYLEPDQRYGRAYLAILKQELFSHPPKQIEQP